MNKSLVFDMDGTIVDLYNVDNWIQSLNNRDITPYAIAEPLYNMDELNDLLLQLKTFGYTVKVVSWNCKSCIDNPKYLQQVEQTKKEWLQRYNFPCDECYVVPYGKPKQEVVSAGILIDDNYKVRQKWTGETINAKHNIIPALQKLIVKELIKRELQEEVFSS